MSLLEAIVNKKSKLKPNETRVTTPSGQVYTEVKSASGDTVQVEVGMSSPGYVIDETPDLQVGMMELNWKELH